MSLNISARFMGTPKTTQKQPAAAMPQPTLFEDLRKMREQVKSGVLDPEPPQASPAKAKKPRSFKGGGWLRAQTALDVVFTEVAKVGQKELKRAFSGWELLQELISTQNPKPVLNLLNWENQQAVTGLLTELEKSFTIRRKGDQILLTAPATPFLDFATRKVLQPPTK